MPLRIDRIFHEFIYSLTLTLFKRHLFNIYYAPCFAYGFLKFVCILLKNLRSKAWVLQTSKQNITRDIEIKNKLTVTKRELGEDNGGKRVKCFQE